MTNSTRENPTGDHLLAVIGRVFSDPEFARSLENDPVATLRTEGVALDESQMDALRRSALVAADEGDEGEFDPESGLALTRPVVRIITHGTRPVAHVAVSVAVDTSIPHVEEPVPIDTLSDEQGEDSPQ